MTIVTIGLVSFIGKIDGIINSIKKRPGNAEIYFTMDFMIKDAYLGIAMVLICVQVS